MRLTQRKLKANLITAMLENQDGKFLLPNVETITAAVAVLTPRTPPDERLTLAFAPGADSYPLINYEYAIVSDQQPNPQVASAISSFCSGVSRRKAAARQASLSQCISCLCRYPFARAVKFKSPKSNRPSLAVPKGDRHVECSQYVVRQVPARTSSPHGSGLYR
jgi:hypothetical protein